MNIFEHIYVSNITKEALESLSAAILCVNFERILTISYFCFQTDSCDYEAYFWKILIKYGRKMVT